MSVARDWVVVLAAGRGRRMGGPKALMEIGGEVWWRVQKRRLERAGLGQVWVVSAEVRDALEAGEADVDWMAMGDGESPMFESVRAGVSALEEVDGVGGVFVLPVDVPAARPDVWEALRGDEEEVCVPVYGGERGHPVWLGWKFVEDRVLGSPQGSRLDRLIEGVVREVEVDDWDVIVDLNRPGDVEEWTGGEGEDG